MKIRNKKRKVIMILLLAYIVFIFISHLNNFSFGQKIGDNFISFLTYMLKVLPCAFVLIGLFEVWVPRAVVVRHFGEMSGVKGILWAIILAGTAAGGLIVALPVASSLYRKGGNIINIFVYLGASAIVRIPMTMFEISFLGIYFTLIRWLVSLPLIIISSFLLGNYFNQNKFQIKQ